MKKRVLGILLTVVLVITLFVGCGNNNNTPSNGDPSAPADSKAPANSDTPAQDVELTMWTIATESDAFHQPYLKAIADFEAAHPGVTIKMETFENEAYKTKIKAAVAANELPDVFFTWAGGFSESFVESGKVLSLDDYYAPYKDSISMAALSNDVYDGKLYGSVTCTPVSVMWYNQAIFDANGVKVPTNIAELKDACQKLKAAGITPIASSAKDTWVLAMLHDGLTLKSAGADKVVKALKKQGQSYNDPDFLASATALKELVDMGAFIDGATGLSNDEASASFYAEQAAMYFTGSWMGGSIVTDAAPEALANFSVAPIPVINDANAALTDFMGGGSDTLMVAKSTKNADLAAAAAFEITKGVSKYAFLSGAGIPAWNVDYEANDVPALSKKVADYATGATSFTLWFDTLMSADDAGEYLSLLQQLFTGDVTPEDFVKGMDAQLSK